MENREAGVNTKAGTPKDPERPQGGETLPSAKQSSAMANLSESELEAACEVMAEEGAIWSGAR